MNRRALPGQINNLPSIRSQVVKRKVTAGTCRNEIHDIVYVHIIIRVNANMKISAHRATLYSDPLVAISPRIPDLPGSVYEGWGS